MKKIVYYFLFLTLAISPIVCFSGAVDTDGNAVTNQTAMGNIDMGVTTVGDFFDLMPTDLATTNYAYDVSTNAAMDMGIRVIDAVTNSAFAGYGYPFSPWTYTPSELGLTQPTFTNNLWRFTETNSQGVIVGSAYWIEQPEDTISMQYTLNTTNVVFSRTGSEIWTNSLGFVTLSNMSQYVKHTQLNKRLEDYVSNETLENYDASYKIVDGISTENQTIQVVVNESLTVEPLNIELPLHGRCNDWIVYVVAATNMTLSLPPADYWIRNDTVTNDIAAGTPTALYFSQVSTNNIFTIGRQEYIPITVSASRDFKVRETIKKLLKPTNQKKSALRLR